MTWRQAIWVGAVLAAGILAVVIAMGAIETLRDGAGVGGEFRS